MKQRNLKKMSDKDLIKIASKYSTRSEFRSADSYAIIELKKRNLYEIACEHMPLGKFSTPQLMLKFILEKVLDQECRYNDRSEIAPYELDIFFPNLKFAVEFNGSWWHKSEKVKEKDRLKNEICLERGILLITIEEDTKYFKEPDCKRLLIKNLDKINEWCNTEISEDGILNIDTSTVHRDLLNKEKVEELMSKCKNLQEFAKRHNAIYYRIMRAKKLHWLYPLKEKQHRLDDETIKKKIREFPNKKELREKNPNLYWMAFRVGKEFLKECLSHMPKNALQPPSENFCLSVALNYKNVHDFAKKESSILRNCYFLGIFHKATKHMDRKRWGRPTCFRISKEINSLEELFSYKSFVVACKKLGIFEEIFKEIKSRETN